MAPYVDMAREKLVETPSLRVFFVLGAAVVMLFALWRAATLLTSRRHS